MNLERGSVGCIKSKRTFTHFYNKTILANSVKQSGDLFNQSINPSIRRPCLLVELECLIGHLVRFCAVFLHSPFTPRYKIRNSKFEINRVH